MKNGNITERAVSEIKLEFANMWGLKYNQSRVKVEQRKSEENVEIFIGSS